MLKGQSLNILNQNNKINSSFLFLFKLYSLVSVCIYIYIYIHIYIYIFFLSFKQIFDSCKEIPGENARAGFCDKSCISLYIFMVLFFITDLIGTIDIVPTYLIMIRYYKSFLLYLFLPLGTWIIYLSSTSHLTLTLFIIFSMLSIRYTFLLAFISLLFSSQSFLCPLFYIPITLIIPIQCSYHCI